MGRMSIIVKRRNRSLWGCMAMGPARSGIGIGPMRSAVAAASAAGGSGVLLYSLRGQTVQVDGSGGGFSIPNVSAPDVFPADFMGDDFLYLMKITDQGIMLRPGVRGLFGQRRAIRRDGDRGPGSRLRRRYDHLHGRRRGRFGLDQARSLHGQAACGAAGQTMGDPDAIRWALPGRHCKSKCVF